VRREFTSLADIAGFREPGHVDHHGRKPEDIAEQDLDENRSFRTRSAPTKSMFIFGGRSSLLAPSRKILRSLDTCR